MIKFLKLCLKDMVRSRSVYIAIILLSLITGRILLTIALVAIMFLLVRMWTHVSQYAECLYESGAMKRPEENPVIAEMREHITETINHASNVNMMQQLHDEENIIFTCHDGRCVDAFVERV